MSLKTNFVAFAEKPMDRKEFMKTVGLAAVALSGFAGMLTFLAKRSTAMNKNTTGYSSSNYGNKNLNK